MKQQLVLLAHIMLVLYAHGVTVHLDWKKSKNASVADVHYEWDVTQSLPPNVASLTLVAEEKHRNEKSYWTTMCLAMETQVGCEVRLYRQRYFSYPSFLTDLLVGWTLLHSSRLESPTNESRSPIPHGTLNICWTLQSSERAEEEYVFQPLYKNQALASSYCRFKLVKGVKTYLHDGELDPVPALRRG